MATQHVPILLDISPSPAIVTHPKALSIAPIVGAVIGVPFAVSGHLVSFAKPPALHLAYGDDLARTVALPAAAVVSATAFNFVHPAITTCGSHALSVIEPDSGVGSTVVFTVASAPVGTGVIAIDPITSVFAGMPFLVSGTLAHYQAPPVLSRSDDGCAPVPVI